MSKKKLKKTLKALASNIFTLYERDTQMRKQVESLEQCLNDVHRNYLNDVSHIRASLHSLTNEAEQRDRNTYNMLQADLDALKRRMETVERQAEIMLTPNEVRSDIQEYMQPKSLENNHVH